MIFTFLKRTERATSCHISKIMTPNIHPRSLTTQASTRWQPRRTLRLEKTAPQHRGAAHPPFLQCSRNQPALPAAEQTLTHSSLGRPAVSTNQWVPEAYKIQKGGFCLYSQSFHFWTEHVWMLTAKEFPSWFHIKGKFQVYALCVLRKIIKTPPYVRSGHGASSSILSLPLAPSEDFEKNMLSSFPLTAQV